MILLHVAIRCIGLSSVGTDSRVAKTGRLLPVDLHTIAQVTDVCGHNDAAGTSIVIWSRSLSLARGGGGGGDMMADVSNQHVRHDLAARQLPPSSQQMPQLQQQTAANKLKQVHV